MSRVSVATGVAVGLFLGSTSALAVTAYLENDPAESPRCEDAVAVADSLRVEAEARGPGQSSPSEVEQQRIGRRLVALILSEPTCFSVADVAGARDAQQDFTK